MGFKNRAEHYEPTLPEEVMTNGEVTAVIDLDLICFKAAAAIEERTIKVTHKPTGKVKSFNTRTDFYGRDRKRSGGFLGEINKKRKKPFDLDEFEIEDVQECEHVSHAYYNIKHMITSILKACGTNKYQCYMGRGLNFRDKIATVQEYKGGRESMLKPLLLDEVRSYAKRKFDAIEVVENEDLTNVEADDMLSIAAYNGYLDYLSTGISTTIQCSTDKDSYGCQGMFYNWDKMTKPFLVDGYGKMFIDKKGKVSGYGTVWLLHQCLVGDAVDNYKPTYLSSYKFGEKSSYEFLSPTTNLKEGLEVLVSLYKKWYPEPVTYPHWKTGESITKDWLELASEYFKLAYMLKSLDDDTSLIKLLNENKVEY